jgi:hypothetical protein
MGNYVIWQNTKKYKEGKVVENHGVSNLKCWNLYLGQAVTALRSLHYQ